MRYIDEFRNKGLILRCAQKIKEIAPLSRINIMEVCGTHTQSFYRFGLGELLPQNIKLIAGPGCPVCVSDQNYIDAAISLALDKDNLILTFADMLRVPGTKSSLEKEKARQGNVGIVYSALDALSIARKNPKKKIIFLAVGFETTAPTIALSILAAKKQRIRNLFFFSSLKLIPPAMAHLLKDKRLSLNGFLCPGHVSAIIGTAPYGFIPPKFGIGCCIAGFEPLDILEGIYFLLRQMAKNKPAIENQYARVVTRNGNLKAKKIMAEVFRVCNARWRGLGVIPKSGLKIRKKFSRFDAEEVFSFKLTTNDQRPTTNCKCADILKGLLLPPACPLFGKACSPQSPVGPCMVSNEGACNAYYRYH